MLPLAALGLAVGAVRYALEFVAPQHSMWFGVYYVMAAAYVVVGITDAWGPIRWPAMAGTMICLAFTVWGVWNTVAYTTGQFLGWEHGRFEPNVRAAPVADTTLAKIGWGVAQGFLTSVAASIASILVGTVFIWLPGRLRPRA